MFGFVLGVAIGAHEVCVVRGVDGSDVERWPIPSGKDQVATSGEVAGTAIGVILIRAAREGAYIRHTVIACKPEVRADLEGSGYVAPLSGELTFVDMDAAMRADLGKSDPSFGDSRLVVVNVAPDRLSATGLRGNDEVAAVIGEVPLAGEMDAVISASGRLATMIQTWGTVDYVAVVGDDANALLVAQALQSVCSNVHQLSDYVDRCARGAADSMTAPASRAPGGRRHAATPTRRARKVWWRP